MAGQQPQGQQASWPAAHEACILAYLQSSCLHVSRLSVQPSVQESGGTAGRRAINKAVQQADGPKGRRASRPDSQKAGGPERRRTSKPAEI
jgi:tRNA(Met) C34 N-acetyltransferase TmcA